MSSNATPAAASSSDDQPGAQASASAAAKLQAAAAYGSPSVSKTTAKRYTVAAPAAPKTTMKATAARAPISPRTHGKRQKGRPVPPEVLAMWAKYAELKAALGVAKDNVEKDDAGAEEQKELKRAKHRVEALRNRLMENYLHLVRYNAERIHQKLPDEVDLDDLMSAGVFGLMDAIEGFRLDKGVKFETFSAPRIRGAILDELRSMDWVPRLVRSRAHKLSNANYELEATLGRAPTAEESAQKMGVDSEEFNKIHRDAQAVGVVSLSRKWFETDGSKDVREIDVLEDKKGKDPVRDLAKKDLKELMCRGLTRAERLIVILYYFEEMTMKEIGATLDLSESRVSQMHSGIITRLKNAMDDRQGEMATVNE
jgi:RNA polymerase sigma factor for flagellar operon FliA